MALLACVCTETTNSTPQASTSNADWPMFGQNPARTGFTNSSAPKTSPSVLWEIGRFNNGNIHYSFHPIVISNGIIYDAEYKDIIAYNATTGEELWQQPDVTSSLCAIAEGVLYSAGRAFNASTGEKIWTLTDGLSTGVVGIANGYLYTQIEQKLAALNSSTGSLVWTSDYYCASLWPSISNGYIYFNGLTVSSEHYSIVALNAYTGAKLWSTEMSDQVTSSIAVAYGRVYAREGVGLLCLDAMTGKTLWNYTLGRDFSNFFESSPTVAYGYVYVGSGAGNLYALNASSGEKIWNFTVPKGYSIESAPAVADGTVYFVADDGVLYALNAYNGDKLWSYTVGKPPVNMGSSPVIANGCIYINPQDSRILALEPCIDSSPSPIQMSLITIGILVIIIAVCVGLIVYYKKISKN
jgi:eukaryotic-like serine/threonine-protein kinase